MTNEVTHSTAQNSPVSATDNSDPVRLMSHFYQQLVEIKGWIYSGRLNDEVTKQFNLNRIPTGEEVAEAIALRLQRWIEKIRMDVRKILTESENERIDQTLYILVALADELFIIELNWSGREHWQEQSLEQRMFNSCFAGEQFFRQADSLLADRIWDAQQHKLASVYLFALRLGFCGRYRNVSESLAYYRSQLIKRISNGSRVAQVCPQAYEFVLVSQQERRLAPLAGWYRGLVLFGIFYLAAGWGIWYLAKGYWG